MRIRERSAHLGAKRALFLAVLLAAPDRVRGAEPLETIREAFRASSRGLTSGLGKGTYRHYRAYAGRDWQLKLDADLTTYFAGRKYHINLVFHRDDLKQVDSRRIMYDGDVITEAWFTPSIHPTGSQAYVFLPQDYGDGLSRPLDADFPWDVSRLSSNILNLEQLVQKAGTGSFNVAQTTEGDLVATHRLVGGDWIRFEFSRRVGFNVTRMEHFNPGQQEPAGVQRVEWKQGPNGLWYVRSLDETQVLRDAKKAVWRVRDVLKYTEFEPNARVDPELFTEDSLRLTTGSQIIDGRPGVQVRTRKVR